MFKITNNFYSEKLKEFATVYPQENKVSCILYLDWSYDYNGAEPEDEYELRFLELNQQQNDGYLSYLRKGSYRHSKIHNKYEFSFGSGLKPVSVEKLWVHQWNENKEMYILCSSSPHKRCSEVCCSYYDFSFKKGSLLIHESFSKHPEVESLKEKTKSILDLKYKGIEQTALERNYKHGWVFHRMKEPVPEIDKLWQSIGCYYLYEEEASFYMYHFQYLHRPETIKPNLDDWD